MWKPLTPPLPIRLSAHEPGANQPTPDPSQEGNWPGGAAPLLGGAGGGFRGAMRAQSSQGSLPGIMNTLLARRDMFRGTVAFATLAFAQHPLSVFGFDEPGADETVVPFLDAQPKGKMLYWQDLTSWITPNDQLYQVQHYGVPEIQPHQRPLEIFGLVKKPRTVALAGINRRKSQTVNATLACSGN